MKQGTLNSKENKNSVDTISTNNTNGDGSVDLSRKAPANGNAKVIEKHETVTVFNKPVGKESNHSNDEFDEEDFFDPLSFLDEREDSDEFPLSMTITRHRDLTGNLLQKEDQEYIGRFEVNRDRWRDDVKQKVSPGGGRFLVVFRWDAIGPEGQKRGSIAAKYPFFCAPVLINTQAAQVNQQPMLSAEDQELKFLQKLKLYKEVLGGGGGAVSESEMEDRMLKRMATYKELFGGGSGGGIKEGIELIASLKEAVGVIGGGKSGWDVISELANSEVACEVVATIPEIIKMAVKQKDTNTEPPERPKHDAESGVLPEHELPEAVDANAPLPTPERVEMPAAQAALYNKMIERAIQDMLTNSPVDSTAIICEQYFEKYPVDSMELIKQFIAGEDAAIQFLASHTTDAELQKNLLALETGKDWVKRLREKLIPG